jgi:hypothetical protein
MIWEEVLQTKEKCQSDFFTMIFSPAPIFSNIIITEASFFHKNEETKPDKR